MSIFELFIVRMRERIDWCKQKARALIFALFRRASGFLGPSVANQRIYYSTSFYSHAAQRHNRECIYLINDIFFLKPQTGDFLI